MGRHSDDNDNKISDYAEAHPYLGPGADLTVGVPGPDVVNGVVQDGTEPVPLKTPGEPIRYGRDIPRNADRSVLDETTLHIRDHLASIVSPTDDPADLPGDVGPLTVRIVDDDPLSDTVRVVGELDAEPDAPYLRPGFDPDADDGTRFERYSEAGRPGEPS